ncbi:MULTISPECIES: DUF4112 domain-containing protein [unclassified Roseovarius]|uniref:DUF4112 domain-containing protein n=1 Tax=unclassified Roseovarius TaxID=2614913 RepID=UPI00273F1604|nr:MULTISPECIES: DUF4112 domain-containing protein [unclassified Roseovarius]
MGRSELDELDRLSTLLDSRFRVPGTRIRFGWDAILGLIPGIGDVASLAPSAYLIYRGQRLGARKRTIARMALNTGLDFVVGAVPVLGDLFDLFFKANNRNTSLLRKDLARDVVGSDSTR